MRKEKISRMSNHDKIIEVFEEELQRHASAIIDEYVEILSKKYAIPRDMLLRDVPQISTKTNCRGTKSNGQRCTFYGVHEGYCKHHTTQGQRLKIKQFQNSTEHTHGPEKMYEVGCPGCEGSKGLIDLDVFMGNE